MASSSSAGSRVAAARAPRATRRMPMVPNLRSAESSDVAASAGKSRPPAYCARPGAGCREPAELAREAALPRVAPLVRVPRNRRRRSCACDSPAGHGADLGSANPSRSSVASRGDGRSCGASLSTRAWASGIGKPSQAFRNGVYTVYGVPAPLRTAPGVTIKRSWKRRTLMPAARSAVSTRSSRARSAGSYSSFQYTASAFAARAARTTVSAGSPCASASREPIAAIAADSSVSAASTKRTRVAAMSGRANHSGSLA